MVINMKYTPKFQQKRTKPVEKAWYILKPFAVYTVAKTAAMLFLAIAIPAIPISGMAEAVEANSNILSATINALAALIGVMFVMNDFIKEVATSGEVNIDTSVIRQLGTWMKAGVKKSGDKLIPFGAVVSLGITTSLALNILVEIFSVQSTKYDTVEEIQYSVPMWLGLIFYGLISPFVEEAVFRGITYNRMKRFFGIPACVISSSLLFGLFHANLPQFLYGTCMGVLMALCYEWVGSFGAPLLFHMAANVFVYLFSYFCGEVQIVSLGFFMVFSLISVIILCVLYKLYKKRTE